MSSTLGQPRWAHGTGGTSPKLRPGIASVADSPEISVVIPALNASTTIGEQLRSLLSQKCSASYEIVVADNGSNDGTRDVVRHAALGDRRVRLVDASASPLGGSGAKNLGVREARGVLVAFADADDVVAPGWLEAAKEGLRQAHAVTFTREYWTLNPELPRSLFRQTAGGSRVMGVDVVAGGAFGIWRDLYLAVGGFDEDMKGAVDSEFGMRLYRHVGQAPLHIPEAVVHVRVPVDPIQRFRRYRVLSASKALLVQRHGDLVQISGGTGWATIKGWGWLMIHLKMLLSRQGRLEWMQTLGARMGHIDGWRRYGRLLA